MTSLIFDTLVDMLTRRERARKLHFISRAIFIAISFALVGYGAYLFLSHYTAVHPSTKLTVAYAFGIGELIILIRILSKWLKLKKSLISLSCIIRRVLKFLLDGNNRKFTTNFIILATIVIVYSKLKRT